MKKIIKQNAKYYVLFFLLARVIIKNKMLKSRSQHGVSQRLGQFQLWKNNTIIKKFFMLQEYEFIG